MDYSTCDLVEAIPGRMSGVPVIKGTRVPVEAIEIGLELGQTPEELAYDYRLDVNQVRKLFDFLAKAQTASIPHP